MNVFTFVGNLGGDAEVRYTPSGDPVASFSVAVKSGYGDKEKANWIRCNLWGKRAESLAKHLKKGTQVGISGEFSLRDWQDKDGQTKVSAEVRVNDLTLCGSKRTEGSGEKPQQSYAGYEDDIPF